MRVSTLDTVTTAVFLCFGIWILVRAFALGVVSEVGPGPGTFPMVAGILITVFSAVALVRSRREPEASTNTETTSTDTVITGAVTLPEVARVAGITGATLVYLAVFGSLGAFLPLPFLMVAISLIVHSRWEPKWLATITGISVVFTFACYLIFEKGLNVLLPDGPLGF